MGQSSTPPHPMGSASLDEHRRRGRAGGRVLVLNATYEPINVCTVRRAVVLLLKAKAEIVEHATWELRSERASLSRRAHTVTCSIGRTVFQAAGSSRATRPAPTSTRCLASSRAR